MSIVKRKNETYKTFIKISCTGNNYLQLQHATNLVIEITNTGKQKYYHQLAMKLNNKAFKFQL